MVNEPLAQADSLSPLDENLFYEECSFCQGFGTLLGYECDICDGTGYVEHSCNG